MPDNFQKKHRMDYVKELLKKCKSVAEDLNDLTHPKVEPKPVQNIVGDWKKIDVAPPTANDSPETKREMEMMTELFKERNSAVEKSVENHDQETFYGIEKYLMQYNLEYDMKDIKELKKAGSGVVRFYKNKFQRPRPYELADAMNMKFDSMELISDTMKTPAYPSGHSLQSRLLAEYYGKLYPKHKDNLIELADECGYGRVVAGWHYPSDHLVSVKIAQELINMVNIQESIIDIPRKTYAPGVFDDEDTNNPKLKPSVVKQIQDQIKVFAKDYPVIKYGLIGSILTKRYRNDADLDINVLFDVPVEKREDERVNLSQKYLSAKNPNSVNGKLIPGTKHPINYYFLTDEETYKSQEKKADAVFSITRNVFVKRPDDFTFNVSDYIDDFNKKVQEIDVVKGELKRDIIDYDELQELGPNDIENLQGRIESKLEEIENDIEDIIKIGDGVDADRRSAFDKDMSPDEIRKYGIKNRLPKNVIYKMLEKYHYITFYKKCKKILDDGEVTDAEIDSLKTEAVGTPKKHIAFTFGRFNPPTIGHEKLINKVASVGANDYLIVPSGSQDPKKNPLKVNDKIRVMKSMFPRHASKIKQITGARTAIEVVNKLNGKANEITMVVGSDRVREFETLLKKYNGVQARGTNYEFDKINIVSAGERDPDAEGAMGMSASKMRDAATKGDLVSFKKGLPTTFRDKEKLFGLIRKGMNLAAGYGPGLGTYKPMTSIENFTQWQLRDLYIREQIFNINDMAEDQEQEITGKVIRRSTNYIVLEDNNSNLHKCWIWNCVPQSFIDETKLHEINLNVDYGFEAVSETEVKMNNEEYGKKLPQDKDVKDKKGTQPKKYYKDMKKGEKEKRAAHFAKQKYKKSDGDKDYKAAPGDKGTKTKTSVHTKKYHQMYGKEAYEIGKDWANHTKDMTPGETSPERPITAKERAEQSPERINAEDIQKWASSSETIDKYKKRYGEEYQKELDEAVNKMEERLKVQSFKEYVKI